MVVQAPRQAEEFDAAYQRLKDHGVAVTEIIERGYGKTFYFQIQTASGCKLN